MTTQLSKQEMETIAGSCDDVKDGVIGTGTTVTTQSAPAVNGFLLQGAIGDVNKHWKEKADHNGKQWRYFASAVRATAASITSTDEEIAFTLPKVGKDEADVPVPLPFRLFAPNPPAN